MAKAINVSEQRQRVIHLIPDASFEHGEHVGRETSAQTVGAERPKTDADECRDGANQHERAVHSVDCTWNRYVSSKPTSPRLRL